MSGEIAGYGQGVVMTTPPVTASTAAPSLVNVNASPYVYTNTSTGIQQALISGTLSLLSVTRGATNISLDIGDGTCLLGPGDYLTLEWVITAPVLTVVQLL